MSINKKPVEYVLIVPCRDSYDIDLTIESALKQTLPFSKIILVVGKNDTTKEHLSLNDPRIVFHEIVVPSGFIRDAQYKRQQGAYFALRHMNPLKRTFFVLSDSKCILDPDMVHNADVLRRQTKAQVIAGITPDWDSRGNGNLLHTIVSLLQDKALVTNNPSFPEMGWMDKQSFAGTENLPVGGALVFSEKALRAVLPDFAVDYSRYASTYDDYLLAYQVVDAGFKILLTNKVVAHHRHRREFGEYLKQVGRSGQSAAVMLRQYPECPFGHRRFKQVLMIWTATMLGFLLSFLLIAFTGLTGAQVLALLGSAGYVTLGIANVIKARSVLGFVLPMLSIICIYQFGVHFTRTHLIKDLAPEQVQSYLQIQ